MFKLLNIQKHCDKIVQVSFKVCHVDSGYYSNIWVPDNIYNVFVDDSYDVNNAEALTSTDYKLAKYCFSVDGPMAISGKLCGPYYGGFSE